MPFQATAYVPSIKPGTYPAICTDVEEKTSRKDGSTFRVWHFQLTDGSLRTVDGSSSLYTSSKSKGGKWIAALIGHYAADDEMIAPEGKPCQVAVMLNDEGYEYVESVLPPVVAPPATPTTAEALRAATGHAAEQHAAQEGDELPF